jgi:hypothetical protein
LKIENGKLKKGDAARSAVFHFQFCIFNFRRGRGGVGTEGRARTADPQIHNLVL